MTVWKYDTVAQEIVTAEELDKRKAERKSLTPEMRADLPSEVIRGAWVQDRKTGKLVDRDEYYANRSASGLTIMKDIEPYKNVVDGGVIGGRKQHKDFMRARGLVEIGNEKVEKKYEAPPGLRDDLKRALHEVGGDL